MQHTVEVASADRSNGEEYWEPGPYELIPTLVRGGFPVLRVLQRLGEGLRSAETAAEATLDFVTDLHVELRMANGRAGLDAVTTALGCFDPRLFVQYRWQGIVSPFEGISTYFPPGWTTDFTEDSHHAANPSGDAEVAIHFIPELDLETDPEAAAFAIEARIAAAWRNWNPAFTASIPPRTHRPAAPSHWRLI